MNTQIIALSYYIAPLIGIVTIGIGLLAILKPKEMSKNFGIKANDDSLAFVISLGIRDIFMGLTVLILYFYQLWLIQSLIQFCIGLVAISDFLVVFKNGDKKTSYTHLAGAIAVIAYGLWLLLAQNIFLV